MLRALLLSTALALPVLIGVPDAAAADVTVTYIAPEKFRDREFRQERTRDSALSEFDKEFAKLAERYVPAGQELAIEVLDIDLALTNIQISQGLGLLIAKPGDDFDEQPLLSTETTVDIAP